MQKKTNEQFMILSVIGILIVVICHLARDIYKYLEFLPYIAIFVFVSGYFYKEKNEEKPLKHIWYKFKKLMVPFLIINLIYGIIVAILKGQGVIYFGEGINLFTLFAQPFINNNQFVFNFPAWFVPSLFLTYTIFFLIHKLSRKLINSEIKRETTLFIIFIILQIVATFLQSLIAENEYIVIILRIMFFLPFLEFGHIYKEKLQKYDDKIPTIPYLVVLMGINYIIYKIFGDLNYDMHEFSGFKGVQFLVPTITSFIGILVYTRIARIKSKKLGKNKLINYISNNTFSIMTHHVFVAFLVGFVIYMVNMNILPVPNFDVELFKKGWIYIYNLPHMQVLIQILYIIIGIAGSLIIHWIYELLVNLLKKFKQKIKGVKA